MSILTRWVGLEGRAFERVARAFVLAGYVPPTAEAESGDGSYVASIAQQYYGYLTQPEVETIVRFGLRHSLEDLMLLQPGDYFVADMRESNGD